MEFHTQTGRLSLDWIATLGDRDGTPIERLADKSGLERWFATVAGQAVTCGPGDLQGDDDLQAARRLRGAIINVLDRLGAGREPGACDVSTLNRFALSPPPAPQLGRSGRTMQHADGISAQTVFGLIARDAIDLFVSGDLARVKQCAAPDCSVHFVDLSRPGQRRWCSMRRCGNRAKKKTFTARHARKQQTPD